MSMQSDSPTIDEAVVIDNKPADSRPIPQNIWMHGLTVLVIMVLAHLALTVMGAAAVIQFVWMLVKKERNQQVADFGTGIANWLSQAAAFVTGKADGKPFPWGEWKA